MFVKKGLQSHMRMLLSFAAAFSVVIALLLGVHAFAQTTQSNTPNTLKVSPVRSDIEILPGQSKVVETTVTNLTGSDVLVSPIENDFISNDESGTPALILDADKYAPTHSLKRFMSPLENVVIPAGKAKTISVTITVPASAQPGGYFGAIRFAPADPDGGAQVNLSASVASLILLTVTGDAVEQLNMTEFSVQQNGKSDALFMSSEGISSTFRFENTGGVQLGPFGKISIKKGDKIISETDFNDGNPRDVILPDSARRWTVPIENIDGFGKYTVLATLTYGSTNQTVDVTRSFWVIPWGYIIGAIIAVLLLIAVIVFIVLRVVRHRKRHSTSHARGGLNVHGRRRR